MNLDIRDPEEMEYINMCLKKYRSNRVERSRLLRYKSEEESTGFSMVIRKLIRQLLHRLVQEYRR